ncbi:hypothetical protein NX862_04605 [Rhodobacter sp. KR11]|uniref:hypothetical protein n=1 Tax=Rhodobacter sp. KR11 TaxID=2974588 RepID=UPI002222E758|nr:hypothetical protein [Rhodobacter sp. KR11]MCW1918025.1 hypothetical protein [Rhodobacter sp. KR11]
MQAQSEIGMATARETISAEFAKRKSSREIESLKSAWDEFNETLIVDDKVSPPVMRNSVRPSAFFNLEDLHFGPGFFRILPGIFVSVGLALTFLGLIAALHRMASKAHIDEETMRDLLTIASAKFIMSLCGLVCSIALQLWLRLWMGKLDHDLHQLCRDLEQRLTYLSLEELGQRQLDAIIESREHQRRLATEMVAELGRPLREELPLAIASSISSAMQPLLDQVSRQGTDSMGTMAADLSRQLTSGIGGALAQAAERMGQAGDRLGSLADRMDQSSGRMGSEMEQVVARVGQAVDDLRKTMTDSAQSASGAFAAGTDQILGAMNRTLESIRDNTGEGARAISAAAAEMRDAALAMRLEMEGAAKSGAQAAKDMISAAGTGAGEAIDGASRQVLEGFSKAGAEIARLGAALSDTASRQLLDPFTAMTDELDGLVKLIGQGSGEMRRAAEAVRDGASAGAEAATSFRGASQDLIQAAGPVRSTQERIETSLRSLAEATQGAVATVTQSSRTTAEQATLALTAARETISAERRGIEASLAAVQEMLARMRGQGDRLDTIDTKLGKAFDLYTGQTENAMQSIRAHVSRMADEMNQALSTLNAIVEGLQEFQPQQRRS